MEKTIRWGILGPGWISEKFAVALRQVPHAELFAVGSRSQERADAFARRHGFRKSYGSYERFVEDRDVDVVYVATPHPFHCSNTLLCLDHGKAVLCEKPFAMNEKEVRIMITRARSRGIFLMEAMWSRFLPSVEKVLDIIRSGAIGDIVQVRSDLGFRAAVNPDGRLYNPALGGGALLDVGVYPAFMTTLLLGEPATIRSHAVLTDRGVDTSLSALLSYPSGTMASISCAITAETATETEIAGTAGTIHMHKKWFMPSPVTVRYHDGRSETFDFFVASNGYECEAIEVTTCLREGKLESQRMPPDFSLKLIRLLDAIRSQQNIVYDADRG